jgi:hypothetical protein
MLHEANEHLGFLMDDSNKNGLPNLIAIKRRGTSDGNIEVNTLNGFHEYRNFTLRIAIPNFTPLRVNMTNQLEFILTD